MATQAQEFKAKSVDEAIAEGLAVLGVERNAVEIEIVNKGSRGIFGIGSEPAVVRLTLRSASSSPAELPKDTAATEVRVEAEKVAVSAQIPADDDASDDVELDAEIDTEDETVELVAVEDEPTEEDHFEEAHEADQAYSEPGLSDDEDELAAMAADMLDEMIHLMGFKAEVRTSWFDETDDDFEEEDEEESEGDLSNHRTRYLRLDVEGTDLGALIGRRGETLENIQYLLRLMVNQRIHRWKNIIVDVEHYKERRVNQLTQLAERMAEQVAHSGRTISLEPMPANERRIVHMVLRNHPDVYTESYGEGPRRKVHIFARD